MRNLYVLCVGKLKEPYLRDGCLEYAKRLNAYCRLAVAEVDEERLPENPSPAQIQAAITAEGNRLLAKTVKGTYKIAFCIEGQTLSSTDFAVYLDKLAVQGQGDVTFYIGGSRGLSDEVKTSSDRRLSMSPMTFPHQLARVMVLEQLYRAMQISSGGKYHK